MAARPEVSDCTNINSPSADESTLQAPAAARRAFCAVRQKLLLREYSDADHFKTAEGKDAEVPERANSLVVGIDDTYVKHRQQFIARQFQVTAGRVERDGKLGARFVFVSSNPGWTDGFFDGFLLQQGMRRNTVMRVVTDGDDGLRKFVPRTSPRPMESQLDWFHIGMKLELLRKAVVMPVSYQEYFGDPHAFDPVRSRVFGYGTRFGEVNHGKRVSNLHGCEEISTDGPSNTRGVARRRFGAPDR